MLRPQVGAAGKILQVLHAVIALSASSALAAPPSPADAKNSSANLDGLYISVGPLASLTRIDGEWTTGTGAELSVVHVTERSFPAAYGLALGGVGFTERDGGRLWVEAEIAIQEPLPFAVGLGLGAAAEVDAVRPPRFGAQATLWIFAGIVPYFRVGTVAEGGPFAELGVMIKLPAVRFY